MIRPIWLPTAHSPRAGGDLQHVPGGRVVDEHRCRVRGELVERLAELGELLVAQTDARSELVAVDSRPGAEHALADFEVAHFQADEEDGDLRGRCRHVR